MRAERANNFGIGRAGVRSRNDMGMMSLATVDPRADREHKLAALNYLHEAWAEARHDGIDGDCLAQACLFAAFAELVTTYGEEAAAQFADGLALRIRNGEFSIMMARQ